MESEKVKKKRRKRRKRAKRSSEGVASRNEGETETARSEGTQSTPGHHPRVEHATEHTKKRPFSSNKGDSKRGHKRQRQRDAVKERAPASAKAATTCPQPALAFEVDSTDHCETPLEAYRGIATLLDQIAKSLAKSRASLSIYDPYFCDGGVQLKLNSLGFHNVTNENKDFYKAIKNGTVPAFDVLVTNPPYSGTHVEKLLAFVSICRKPFLLLLPHYVYTKDYYHHSFGSNVKPFFLVPKSRYSYLPPKWVQNGSTALTKGKDRTSPFPSFWYCRAENVSPDWLSQTYGTSGVYRHDRKLQYANCAAHIPRDMKGEFDSTKKRPNPKARKRAAAKKRVAMAGM